MNRAIDRGFLPIEPIRDTWEIRGDVATWYINFKAGFATLSTQEINAWYAKSFFKILDSFALFARLWQVRFRSNAKSKTDEQTMKWESGIEYEKYIDMILESIKNFPDAIEQLELNLDLYVFVRTEESPDKPIQSWVRHMGNMAIRAGKESEKYAEPVVYMDIDHTLFCPSSMCEVDNSDSYNLNQPLLEKALRNWEQKFGIINEI